MSEEAIRDLVEVGRPHLLNAKRWLIDHVAQDNDGSSVNVLLRSYLRDHGFGNSPLFHVEFDLENPPSKSGGPGGPTASGSTHGPARSPEEAR